MVGSSLSSLPKSRRAEWSPSCSHLGPEEASELPGDGGGHDVARALLRREPRELGAQVELGSPCPGDGRLAAALLPLLDDGSDASVVLIGPGALHKLAAPVRVAGLRD